jgi:hypothetical protein
MLKFVDINFFLRNPFSALTLPNSKTFNTEGVRRFPTEGSPSPNTSPVLQSRRVQPSYSSQQSSSTFSSQPSSSAFSSQPPGNSISSQPPGNSISSQPPGNSITRLAPNFFRFVPPRVSLHLDGLQAENSSRVSMGSQPGTSGLSRQHSLSRGAKLVHLSLSRANSNESDSSLLYEEVCQEINTHPMPDGRVVTETSTTVVVEDERQVNYLDMLVLQ